MDGLSAAASGIAVVSLAIQLVDSVREMQRFLRDVSEAPKELRRLIDLLEQLELILENIGALVERQQQGAVQTELDLSASILKAMKTCESKLKMLEDVVGTAKKSANATNKATRKFGDFRLACKKDNIEDCERQLHDAISLLHLAMTTNLTVIHSQGIDNLLAQVQSTNQITATISRDLLLLKNASSHDTKNDLCTTSAAHARDNKDPTKTRLLKRRDIVVSSFSGPFGRLSIRREVQDSVSKGYKGSFGLSQTQRESTWVFIPSFLSYAFDFRYLNSCGHAERTLRVYPVLSYLHPVWQMCRKGDLKGIQRLLGDKEVSPFSVDDTGNTLLHRSAERFHTEICKFLFDIGITGRETNIDGRLVLNTLPPPPLLHDPPPTSKDLERTYEIVSCRMRDLDPTSFQRFLFSGPYCRPPIRLFTMMVFEWLTKENVNQCSFSPLAIAAYMFADCIPTVRHHWKPIIRHLIHLGIDLHRGSVTGRTVLDHLLNSSYSPFEARPLCKAWLDLLVESGIDVTEYLWKEYSIHYDLSLSRPMLPLQHLTGYRPRLLIISKAPYMAWDWFIDSEGNAADVLEEFKNFGPCAQNIPGHMYYVHLHTRTSHNWPFFYPEWQWHVWEKDWGSRNKVTTALAQRTEARYERRWHKKALKLARAQGTIHRGPRMPGAWID